MMEKILEPAPAVKKDVVGHMQDSLVRVHQEAFQDDDIQDENSRSFEWLTSPASLEPILVPYFAPSTLMTTRCMGRTLIRMMLNNYKLLVVDHVKLFMWGVEPVFWGNG
jgi:hypothetical protein